MVLVVMLMMIMHGCGGSDGADLSISCAFT